MWKYKRPLVIRGIPLCKGCELLSVHILFCCAMFSHSDCHSDFIILWIAMKLLFFERIVKTEHSASSMFTLTRSAVSFWIICSCFTTHVFMKEQMFHACTTHGYDYEQWSTKILNAFHVACICRRRKLSLWKVSFLNQTIKESTFQWIILRYHLVHYSVTVSYLPPLFNRSDCNW